MTSDSKRGNGELEPEQRDAKGRFLPGCKGGPGNPRLRKQAELQEAVRGALSAADLHIVMSSLLKSAQRGDVQAAGLLLAHAVGRPREAEPSVDLGSTPDLATVSGIRETLSRIVAATASGDLEIDVADRLVALVESVADAGAMVDLETRIAALEARQGGR